MSVDAQFNRVGEKLQQLLRQHQRLQKEAEALRKELAQAKEQSRLAAHTIESLNQQVTILKLSAGELKEKDKKAFEKQLNQYIREVDRCISFLSE